MPSSRFPWLLVAAALVLFTNALFVPTAAAQDAVTVGTVNAAGPSVDVPVYIRDVSGTPLGMDQPAASRIQAFSIRVTYGPAAAVSSVTFGRAGITSGLTPTFQTSPASAGAISLLASFQQSTNPIPFSSNASAPGNLVAHLVFQLSPSATPGTDITLTLDSSTTQLTDEGGTAATKETSANGRLGLNNGVIHIPVPSLTLSPSAQTFSTTGSGTLSVRTSVGLVNDTTVTLVSSNTAVATVPASVVIAAGSQLSTVTVSPRSPGTATITATLPASSGGGTATATVTVTQSSQCLTPAAPQISGPASVLAGTPYTITWADVNGATEYVIDEATEPSFLTADSRTVTTTSASYTHDSAGVRYYYRVRARNHGGTCDVASAPSAAVTVLITAIPPPATRILPVVGSTQGSFGSFFKTSLQLYNPKAAAVSGRIIFHTQAVSGASGDPSFAYSIPAGHSLAFADLLPAMGLAGGLGSADLVADATSAFPVALARVFNDAGPAGTTGLTLEALAPSEALHTGDSGALLVPADMTRFRLNVGVRTLEQGVTITITVRDRDGAVLKALEKTFAATFFRQIGSTEFLDGFVLTGGETISLDVTNGAAFLYGATTDNITNDPSVQLARRIE
jgi:hypothetical protein